MISITSKTNNKNLTQIKKDSTLNLLSDSGLSKLQRLQETKAQQSQVQENNTNKNGFLGGLGYLGEKIGLGFLSSIDGIWDYTAGGLAKLFGNDAWAEEQFNTDLANYNHADEWFNPSSAWKVAGDVAGGIGTSLPAIAGVTAAAAIAAASGGSLSGVSAGLISASIAGLSAAGNATKEAYQQTGNLGGKEFAYGTLSGVTEGSIEGFSSVIGAGSGAVIKNITKSFSKEVAQTAVKSATRDTIGKTIFKSFVGEALEEGVTEWITPEWKRKTYDPSAKNATAQEIGYSSFIGGLSGAIMGGVDVSIRNVSSLVRGNNLVNENKVNDVIETAKNISTYERANKTTYESYQMVDSVLKELETSLATTNGEIKTSKQKMLLGALESANTISAFTQPLVESAEKIYQNADVIAEKLKAYGYTDANGKAIEFTAEQIRSGIDTDIPQSFEKALKTNSILRTLAVVDVTGQMYMDTKKFADSALKGEQLSSQVDLNKFIEKSSKEEKAAVGEKLGISDWNTLTNEKFNEKIRNFAEMGGIDEYKSESEQKKQFKDVAVSTAKPKIPSQIAFKKDGIVRYAQNDIELGIMKQDDSYRLFDYSTDKLSKTMDLNSLNKTLKEIKTKLQDTNVTEGVNNNAEAETDIDTYARENISVYKDIGDYKQNLVRGVIRQARAADIAEADALSYARVSANTGIDMVFDKDAVVDGRKILQIPNGYADGVYLKSENKIYINPECSRPHEKLLLHELTHAIFSTKDGEVILMNGVKNMSQTEKQSIINRYKSIGHGGAVELIDELNAYYAEGQLSNKNLIEKLCEKQPTLKDKILSFFKKSADTYKEDQKLTGASKKLYNQYKKMFDSFVSNKTNNADMRYSFSNQDSDGNALTPEQQEFFKDSQIKVKKNEDGYNEISADGSLFPVYHGTNSNAFTVFDKKAIGSTNDRGWYGNGFYFAFRKGEAETYGKNVLKCYLNIAKPFFYQEELEQYNGKLNTDANSQIAAFFVNLSQKFPKIAKNVQLYADMDLTSPMSSDEHKLSHVSVYDFSKQIMDIYNDEDFSLINASGEYMYKLEANIEKITGDKQIAKLIKDKLIFFEYLINFRLEEGVITEAEAKKLHEIYAKYGNNLEDKFIRLYAQTEAEAKDCRLGAALSLAAKQYSYIDIHYLSSYYTEEFGDEFTSELKSRGYDGIVQSKTGDEIVVFDSNQIKLTTNKTPTADKDIRYALKPFAEQVDDVLNGSDTKNTHLQILDTTPKLLQEAGLPNLPMLMTAKHLKTITQANGKEKANYHNLSIDTVKELPKLLANPIMIMDSLTKGDSVVLLTEAVDKNNNPIIVAIKLDGQGMKDYYKIEANIITSVYGKDNFQSFIDRNASANSIIYWHKKKSQDLFNAQRLQLPDRIKNLNSNVIIRKTNAKVNTSDKNNIRYSLKDSYNEDIRYSLSDDDLSDFPSFDEYFNSLSVKELMELTKEIDGLENTETQYTASELRKNYINKLYNNKQLNSIITKLAKNKPEMWNYFKNTKMNKKYDPLMPSDKDELVVMFHGSPNNFYTFDSNKIGHNGTVMGSGFYFTAAKKYAEDYSSFDGKVIASLLNIEKPLSRTKLTLNKQQLKRFVREVVDSSGEDWLSNYGDVSWLGYEKLLDKAINDVCEYNKNDADTIEAIYTESRMDFDEFHNKLTEMLGYDGVIAWNKAEGTQAIVFRSNQVKDILNFKPTKDKDIRFSLKLGDATVSNSSEGNFKFDEDSESVLSSINKQNEIENFLPKTLSKDFIRAIKYHGNFAYPRLYRGMQAEETESIFENGYIKSKGLYNFSNQEGETFFSHNIQDAFAYATSFAPSEIRKKFFEDGMTAHIVEVGNYSDINFKYNEVNESSTKKEIDKKYITRIIELVYNKTDEKVYARDIKYKGMNSADGDIIHGNAQFVLDKTTGQVLFAVCDEYGYENGKYISEANPDFILNYDKLKNDTPSNATLKKMCNISGNESDLVPISHREVEELTIKKQTKDSDIRYSLKVSEGQLNKANANLTKKKVYNRAEAEEVIDDITESIFANSGDYDAVLKGKGKVIDSLWNELNTKEPGHRLGSANKIADYLMQNISVHDAMDDVLAEEYKNTISNLRPYLHKLDLKSVKSDIRDLHDNNALYLLWSGGTIGPDELKGLLAEDGVIINSELGYSALIEVDTMYRKAVKGLKSLADKKFSEIMTNEEQKNLRQEIAKKILISYDKKGSKSDLTKLTEGMKSTIREWQNIANDAVQRNRIENNILFDLRAIADMKLDKFFNASEYRKDTLKKAITNLAKMTRRGNLVRENSKEYAVVKKGNIRANRVFDTVNQAKRYIGEDNTLRIEERNFVGIRSIINDLKEWYVVGNPIFGDKGDLICKEIVDSMTTLAEGDGRFTVDELRDLRSVASYFKTFIKNFDKVLINGKYVDAKPIVEKHIETIKDNNNYKVGWFSYIKNGYLKLFGDPASVARNFDMYSDGFYTNMFNHIRDGATKAKIIEMNIRKPLDDFYKEHKHYLKSVKNRTVSYLGKEIPLSKAKALYMTLSREQARDGLAVNGFEYIDEKKNKIKIDGYVKENYADGNITDLTNFEIINGAEIQQEKLKAQFNEEDLEWISIVESILNNDCKKLKYETDMQKYGFSNILESYYFPIRRANIAYSIDTEISSVDRVSNAPFNRNTVKGAMAELEIGDCETIVDRHVKAITKYNALASVIEEFNTLFNLDISGNKNKPLTIKSISDGRLADAEAFFKKLIADAQEVKEYKIDSLFKRFIRTVRSNLAKMWLSCNPKVILTQFSSFFASTSILKYNSVIKGFSVSGKEVDKYCELAKLRNNSNVAAMAQGVLDSVGKVGDVLMKPISKTDRFVVKRLFGACQVEIESTKNLKLGTEENKVEAGKLLTKVINETQQGSLATERSLAMRSDSEIAGVITLFSSDSMKVVGRVIDSWGEIAVLKRKIKYATEKGLDSKQFETKLKTVKIKAMKSMVALITTSLYMAMIARLFRHLYRKDEEEKSMETFTVDAIGNLFGGLPIIKEIYSKLVEGYDIDGFEYAAMNKMLQSFKSTYDASANLMSGKGDEKEIRNSLKQLVFAFGQVSGLPTSNVYKISTGLISRFDESTGYKINNFFKDQSYTSELNKAIEEDDEKMIETVAGLILDESVGAISNSNARKEISELLKKGFKVLPKSTPNVITIEDEEISLSKKEKANFNKIYSQANDEVVKLIANAQYKSSSEESKAKAVKFIYDTFYNKAVDDALGTDTALKNVLFSSAIDVSKLALIIANAKSIKPDTIGGKTVAGSLKKKIQKYIQSLNLSAVQKYMVMGYLGYSIKDGDVKSISANKANSLLLKHILSIKGITATDKEDIAELCGFEVKNGKIMTKSLFK